ncbi:hypothetical protein EWM64_g8281 [Hericium alpestre]|uniref:F-box domain-containing protein n=1 Tax=Hericium alpestre TaxID=135208 RepID=A0A4Y9ZN99_9AGAM|nr:hypothetical protein EWM64_g8281 [Hericium alpestre]
MKALFALSLTSKSMLEPCLDALWSSMVSARPLFNIMIPLKTRAKIKKGNPSYHEFLDLVRLLDNANRMTRFYYYANRVKALQVTSGDVDVLLSRALSSQSARANPFLPNLQYIYWPDDKIISLPCIPVLAGPQLMALSLHITAWPKKNEGLLYATFSSLRQACPLLYYLEFTANEDLKWKDINWQFALAFSALFNVTSVKFTCTPSFDTLICLSKMPNLQVLVAKFAPEEPFVWDNVTPLKFPCLRNLRWAAHTVSDAMIFLRRLRLPGRNREIEMFRMDCVLCNPAELSSFFDTLRETCSMQKLSSFLLRVFKWDEPSGTAVNQGPPSSILHPLFEFGNIQNLQIWYFPVELDDALLAAVSTAWPTLHMLQLWIRRPQLRSKITLTGLMTFVRQNRHLVYLAVDIDSWPDDMPVPPPLPAHGVSDTEPSSSKLSVIIRQALTDHLEVVECEKQKAARIQALRRIFPNASAVDYECYN